MVNEVSDDGDDYDDEVVDSDDDGDGDTMMIMIMVVIILEMIT